MRPRAPSEIDLPLPWRDEWPHGRVFLVPRKGVLARTSHPLTINGKPAVLGQTVHPGDVIAPMVGVARFALLDVDGASAEPETEASE